MRSGIAALDERVGGMRPGGLYLVAGAPGSGRLAAVLQFLAAGVEEGERVALLAAARPDRVLEEARHRGAALDAAWRDGRLRLVGYKPEFETRFLSAAEPGEVFEELGRLVGPGVARLGIHPGAPLWESRSGTSTASHFVRWAEALDATTWATSADLEDHLSPATDWVLQGASGAFHIARLPGGLHELRVRHMSPPTELAGPITLEAVPGRGLIRPRGAPARRRTDAGSGSEGRLALLRLTPELPRDVAAWARWRYEAVEVGESLELVERLQEGDAFGLVVVYVTRERLDEAVRACRVLRGLTAAPILVVTDDRVRSSDRVRALEAGAHDVLGGPLNLAELASRAARALEAASGVPSGRLPGPPEVPGDGIVDEASFRRLIRERLSRPEWSAFALVRPSGRPGSAERLQEALVAQARERAGDAVGRLGDGPAVVLQGARAEQARAFVERVRGALGDAASGVEFEILSGLGERERIEAILASADATTRPPGS